jgi:hypothetical protein
MTDAGATSARRARELLADEYEAEPAFGPAYAKVLRDFARHPTAALDDRTCVALRAIEKALGDTAPAADLSELLGALGECLDVLPRFVHSVSDEDKHVAGRNALRRAHEAVNHIRATLTREDGQ